MPTRFKRPNQGLIGTSSQSHGHYTVIGQHCGVMVSQFHCTSEDKLILEGVCVALLSRKAC